MAQDPRAPFPLSPLAKQLLADYIKAEVKRFKGNMSALRSHFEEVVADDFLQLRPGAKIVETWTIRRWERKDVTYIAADSMLQLSIYRGETYQATCTWLDGGDPQGAFLDRFLPALRGEPLTRRELAEVATVVAYRFSVGDFVDCEGQASEPIAVIEASPPLQLTFSHAWYPALLRAAQLFGDRYKSDPDDFLATYGVRPATIAALLAREDLSLPELELQRLVEALAKDETGLTAPELLAILTGDIREAPAF